MNLTETEAGITAAAVTLVLGTLLRMIGSQFQPVEPGGLFGGFRRRSLAMEFVRCPGDVLSILGRDNNWNRSLMRQIQIVDFIFIAGYFTSFTAASSILWRPGHVAAVTSGVFAFLAAWFDVQENCSILLLLRRRIDDSPGVGMLIDKCRIAAEIKWTSMLIAMLIYSWLLFRGYRGDHEIQHSHFISCVLIFCVPPACIAVAGLFALPAGTGSWFEKTTPFIFAGILVLWAGVFLFPPH